MAALEDSSGDVGRGSGRGSFAKLSRGLPMAAVMSKGAPGAAHGGAQRVGGRRTHGLLPRSLLPGSPGRHVVDEREPEAVENDMAAPVFAAASLVETNSCPTAMATAGELVLFAVKGRRRAVPRRGGVGGGVGPPVPDEIRAVRVSPFWSVVAAFGTCGGTVHHVKYCARGDAIVTLERNDAGGFSVLCSYHAWRSSRREGTADQAQGGGEVTGRSSPASGLRSPTPQRERGSSPRNQRLAKVSAHQVPLASTGQTLAVCQHTGRVAVGFMGSIGLWQCSPSPSRGGPFEHIMEIEVRTLERRPFLGLALADQYLLLATSESVACVWLDLRHDVSRIRRRPGGGLGSVPYGTSGLGGPPSPFPEGLELGMPATPMGTSKPATSEQRHVLFRGRHLLTERTVAQRSNYVDYEGGAGSLNVGSVFASHVDGGQPGLATPVVEGSLSATVQSVDMSFDDDDLPVDISSTSLVTDVGVGVQGAGYGRTGSRGQTFFGPVLCTGISLRPNATVGFVCGEDSGTQLLIKQRSQLHDPVHTAQVLDITANSVNNSAAEDAGSVCVFVASRMHGYAYHCSHEVTHEITSDMRPHAGLGESEIAATLAGIDGAVSSVARSRRSPRRPVQLCSYKWRQPTLQTVISDLFVHSMCLSGNVEVWTRWRQLSGSVSAPAALLCVQSLVGPDLPLRHIASSVCATASGAMVFVPPNARRSTTPANFLAHGLEHVADRLPAQDLEMRFTEDDGVNVVGEAAPSDDSRDSEELAWRLPRVHIPAVGQQTIRLDSSLRVKLGLSSMPSVGSIGSHRLSSSFASFRDLGAGAGIIASAAPLPKELPLSICVLQPTGLPSMARWLAASEAHTGETPEQRTRFRQIAKAVIVGSVDRMDSIMSSMCLSEVATAAHDAGPEAMLRRTSLAVEVVSLDKMIRRLRGQYAESLVADVKTQPLDSIDTASLTAAAIQLARSDIEVDQALSLLQQAFDRDRTRSGSRDSRDGITGVDAPYARACRAYFYELQQPSDRSDLLDAFCRLRLQVDQSVVAAKTPWGQDCSRALLDVCALVDPLLLGSIVLASPELSRDTETMKLAEKHTAEAQFRIESLLLAVSERVEGGDEELPEPRGRTRSAFEASGSELEAVAIAGGAKSPSKRPLDLELLQLIFSAFTAECTLTSAAGLKGQQFAESTSPRGDSDNTKSLSWKKILESKHVLAILRASVALLRLARGLAHTSYKSVSAGAAVARVGPLLDECEPRSLVSMLLSIPRIETSLLDHGCSLHGPLVALLWACAPFVLTEMLFLATQRSESHSNAALQNQHRLDSFGDTLLRVKAAVVGNFASAGVEGAFAASAPAHRGLGAVVEEGGSVASPDVRTPGHRLSTASSLAWEDDVASAADASTDDWREALKEREDDLGTTSSSASAMVSLRRVFTEHERLWKEAQRQARVIEAANLLLSMPESEDSTLPRASAMEPAMCFLELHVLHTALGGTDEADALVKRMQLFRERDLDDMSRDSNAITKRIRSDGFLKYWDSITSAPDAVVDGNGVAEEEAAWSLNSLVTACLVELHTANNEARGGASDRTSPTPHTESHMRHTVEDCWKKVSRFGWLDHASVAEVRTRDADAATCSKRVRLEALLCIAPTPVAYRTLLRLPKGLRSHQQVVACVCLARLNRFREAFGKLIGELRVPMAALELAMFHRVVFDQWRGFMSMLVQQLPGDGDVGEDPAPVVSALQGALEFLVTRVTAASFFQLLPEEGSLAFFLPYIARSVSHDVALAGGAAVSREARDVLQFARVLDTDDGAITTP